MRPVASILTTCHNDGATLGTAIASALGQTVRNIEVLILVHGSTDESAMTAVNLEDLDGRVQATTQPGGHEVTLTQPAALNALAARARGDWLIVLNADDVLQRWAVEDILRIAASRPVANCIFSPWQWIGHRSDIYDFAPYTGDRRMLTQHQIPGIRAVRSDLWEALGGEDESIAVGADWDWAVRGAARGLLMPYKHPTPLWLVRDHGPHVKRLSAQCDHVALRRHMATHFTQVPA